MRINRVSKTRAHIVPHQMAECFVRSEREIPSRFTRFRFSTRKYGGREGLVLAKEREKTGEVSHY